MMYAVIDTNVLVSALYRRKLDSATVILLDNVYQYNITPLLHSEIMQEYNIVLYRKKFNFNVNDISTVMDFFQHNGVYCPSMRTNISLPDEKDRVFLEVALAARRKYGTAYLVTGNKKHFPEEPFILSPAELLAIMPAVR